MKQQAQTHYQSLSGEFEIPLCKLIEVALKVQQEDHKERDEPYGVLRQAEIEHGGHFIFNRTDYCVDVSFHQGEPREVNFYQFFADDVKTYPPSKYLLVPYHVHPRYRENSVRGTETWAKLKQGMITQQEAENKSIENIMDAYLAIILSNEDLAFLDENHLTSHLLFKSDVVWVFTLDPQLRKVRQTSYDVQWLWSIVGPEYPLIMDNHMESASKLAQFLKEGMKFGINFDPYSLANLKKENESIRFTLGTNQE